MKQTETNTAEIILHDEGYVAFRYKAGVVVDLKAARDDHEASIKLTNSEPHPTIVDARGLKRVSYEARVFQGREEIKNKITAAAIIVGSLITKVITNLYVTFQKPKFPIKTFSNEKDAMKWLSAFINKKDNR